MAENASLTGSSESGSGYSNHFRCIPATRIFRPSQKAHQLSANQLHKAIITGTSDEEIYTDDLHRLRVQFVWDKVGANDANSSCWIPTVSPWEGVLRVGTPVLVGYLHNDINQPVILGALYDSQQPPLFSEPTMSGLKRRHGTQGDDSYYNELRFNDKKDNAEVYLHACKDMSTNIDNSLTTVIKNSEVRTIEQSRKTEIKQADDVLTIDQGNLTITVSQGQCEITVQGNVTIKSSSNITLQAAQSLTLSAQPISIQAETTLAQKGQSVSVEGTTTSITGSDAVSVKGAAASITGSDSVSITGAMVQLN